jgi:hypothetical protein
MRYLKRYIGWIVLAIVLVMSACVQKTTEPISTENRMLLSCIPQSATMIAYLNMAETLESEMFEWLERVSDESLSTTEHFDEFHQKTGIAPDHIHTIHMAVDRSPEEEEKGDMIIVISGGISREEILEAIESSKESEPLETGSLMGQTIYTLDSQFMFMFPQDDRLVGGSERWLEHWLEMQDLPVDQRPWNQVRWDRLSQLRYRRHGWTSVQHPDMSVLKEFPHTAPFEIIDRMEMGLDLQNGVYGEGHLLCSTTPQAKDLQEAIEGGLAAIRLGLHQERRMVDIINQISLKRSGPSVTIKGHMTLEDLETIAQHREDLATVVFDEHWLSD